MSLTTNRIDLKFATLGSKNEAGLVAFVTAGDPFPDISRNSELIINLAKSGADIIELGIPYSDPLADGPSIQASSQRALDAGITPLFALALVKEVRKNSDVPIVLMTYYNPVLQYGLEKFAHDFSEAGADGIILTDLPPGEASQWLTQAEKKGIATIFLLAPTSTPDRIKAVTANMKSGFIYCVSRTGVTGAKRDVPVELSGLIERIKAKTQLAVGVGFGISNAQHVAQIAKIADAAIIGSALVDYLHQNASCSTILADVGAMVTEWKAATKRR